MSIHEVPSLPYKYSALEPFIDEETMRIHHTKHHQAYVDKLNAALEKHANIAGKDLRELLTHLDKVPEDIRTAVRNNAGGHWNHLFFWLVLRAPEGKNLPTGLIAAEFEDQFTTFDTFTAQFKDKALAHFGSGWVWLVKGDSGKLEIITTPNQDTPIMIGKEPILGLDVWEHAYYLKYQNRRTDYIDAFWNVVNWDRVNELLKGVS